MKSMTLLIKPSSSNCNLNCRYCFYNDTSINRSISSYGFMDIDTLSNIIKNALSEDISICNFIFQGGEPTLVGLDFYENVIKLQNQFNINNIAIVNSIQTNGINIDNDWAKFLKHNNFLVGISLDGPKKIHDLNRINYIENGSFYDVIDSIELLEKYEINFNILCVVTKQTSKYINEIYSFCKSKNFKYLQFIPCIKNFTSLYKNEDFSNNERDYYLDKNSYFKFLDKLFNLWYEDIKSGNFIEIRNFMEYITVIKGYHATSCGMGGFCSLHTVIEANGNVYPCDFYCIDQWKLGNINSTSIANLRSCDTAKKFFERSLYIHDKCKSCKYFKLCGGGCRRNLEPFVNSIPSFNYQCDGIKRFLDNNIKKLVYLSNLF